MWLEYNLINRSTICCIPQNHPTTDNSCPTLSTRNTWKILKKPKQTYLLLKTEEMLTHHLWEYDLLFHLNFSIILLTFIHIFYTYIHLHSYSIYFLCPNSLFFQFGEKIRINMNFKWRVSWRKLIKKEIDQVAIKKENYKYI